MKVNVSSKGTVFLKDITVADTFWLRLSGYQFRLSPHVNGFVFEPGNSIHTFWCFFPLDLIFLSKENKVVRVIRNMKPWRMTKIYSESKRIVEVPAGLVPASITEGDILEVQNV